MFKWLENQGRIFHRPPIGRRFQEFNRRHRDSGFAIKWWVRLLFLSAGAALTLVGTFFVFVPGPAIIFLLPCAALLACESILVARLLDRIDVKCNPMVKRLEAKWRSGEAFRLDGRSPPRYS